MNRKELLRIAKPILFNTQMVSAILEGWKTCTRRIVKYKYSNTEMKMKTDKYGTRLIEIQKDIEGETFGKNPDGSTWHKLLGYIEPKPRYKKGDILYVRETWTSWSCAECDCECVPDNGSGGCTIPAYLYAASDDRPDKGWKPSLHMPKEAARIFLRVTNVRVERLQDITIEEIRKEGLTSMAVHAGDKEIAYKEWEILWNSTLNKKDMELYGWNANPWVWVYEFERVEAE